MGNKAVKFKDSNGNAVYPCPYYPVGSIYMSVNNINPTNFFGGTWEQIKDKFLLACSDTYKVNSTGGNTTTNSTTLTIDQIPSHSHKTQTYKSEVEAKGYGLSSGGGFTNRVIVYQNTSTWTTNATGGGKGHTHTYMPPYLAVYVWKRIA